jgi:5'-3' exonuclease
MAVKITMSNGSTITLEDNGKMESIKGCIKAVLMSEILNPFDILLGFVEKGQILFKLEELVYRTTGDDIKLDLSIIIDWIKNGIILESDDLPGVYGINRKKKSTVLNSSSLGK